jgi:ABC-2 type transport system ATP-binding protein
MAVVETRSLSKNYGSSRGIKEVDLTVSQGEVFGFIGPNGAGKTTTIRLLLDLIRPSAGSAKILEMDCQTDSLAIREKTSYLPGDLALPEANTARQILDHLMRLRRQRIDLDLAERLDLDLDKPVKELSKGNRQKIGLVSCFSKDAELYILDEPTSGLDPLRQTDVRALIKEKARRGKSVFLSSHDLDQVELVADTVAIIKEGSLVLQETMSDLKKKQKKKVSLKTDDASPLQDLANTEDLTIDNGRVDFRYRGQAPELLEALAKTNPTDLEISTETLDEIFDAYYD